jgi:predicted acetyltransferase
MDVERNLLGMADEPALERVRESDRLTKIRLNLPDAEDISRLWLFHYDMRLRSATVTMGGIGGVGTNEEHRKRGYAARLMSDSVAYMAEHDLDIGMLFGIQNFYERWGYITAMATHEMSVDAANLPTNGAVAEVVEYRAESHRDAVLSMYASANTARTCAVVRGPHYWTEFEKGTDWSDPADGKVFVGPDGAPAAYVNMAGDPERTCVSESAFADPAFAPVVASYLARRAANASHDKVTLLSPPDAPLAMYLLRFGCVHRQSTARSGGGMLRIIDLPSLIGKLTGYIGDRATTGRLRGWEGSIALRTDIGSVTLRVRDGVATSEEGSTGDLVAEMPQDRLLQLLVGYCDADTIALDDDVTMSDAAVEVLAAMFPPDTPYMWWSDRF